MARAAGPALCEERRDLLVGRKALLLVLGVDQPPVGGDLEGASRALDELDRAALEGLLEFGGQTGRLGGVVSLGAVFDAELHGHPYG